MKVISIGRGTDCQVVLDEPTISRRHAILKIYPWGKMELVDMGQNGTFVNGVKLSSNVPYPVTRKDVISFAHVRQLDWNMVPDPLRYLKWGTLALLIIALLIGGVLFVRSLQIDTPVVQPEQSEGTQQVDQPANKEGDAKNESNVESAENVKKEEKTIFPKLKDLPSTSNKKKKVEEKPKEEPKEKKEEKPKENTPVYL